MHKSFRHYKIFSRYPWVNPEENVAPYLVIGDDLDSLLSATLWNHVSKPQWKIIGLYRNYQKIMTSPNYQSKLDKAIWMDLDINSSTINSVGHHIILEGDCTGLEYNHLNFNSLRGINLEKFTQKYPLGTIHFLMYLFDIEIPSCKYAQEMIFSADSTWINGQDHRFYENVKSWIQHCIPMESFLITLRELQKKEYERKMKEYFSYLESCGITQGTTQVTSKHLKLSGYQFRFDTISREQIRRRLKLIKSITGWDPPEVGRFNKTISGTRKNLEISSHKNFKLDNLINNEEIFSYVFPYKNILNYTEGIKLK